MFISILSDSLRYMTGQIGLIVDLPPHNHPDLYNIMNAYVCKPY